MYSCVFGSEFIDLVGFFSCYCLTPVTLFIIRSKGPDLVYSKAVCGPYLIKIMIFSVRRPQYFISHTKSLRLFISNATPTPL